MGSSSLNGEQTKESLWNTLLTFWFADILFPCVNKQDLKQDCGKSHLSPVCITAEQVSLCLFCFDATEWQPAPNDTAWISTRTIHIETNSRENIFWEDTLRFPMIYLRSREQRTWREKTKQYNSKILDAGKLKRKDADVKYRIFREKMKSGNSEESECTSVLVDTREMRRDRQLVTKTTEGDTFGKGEEWHEKRRDQQAEKKEWERGGKQRTKHEKREGVKGRHKHTERVTENGKHAERPCNREGWNYEFVVRQDLRSRFQWAVRWRAGQVKNSRQTVRRRWMWI